MLNCLICHLLWCQDVLFSKWHSVVNCSILDISKCLCWEVCGLLRVSTRKCCWSPPVLWDLLFMAVGGIAHPAISMQHPRKFWSFLPIPCQFHFWVKDSDGFTCSVCYFALHLLYTFNIPLILHASMTSEKLMSFVRSWSLHRSGLWRVNMLMRCTAYCSQFNLMSTVLYCTVYCIVFYKGEPLIRQQFCTKWCYTGSWAEYELTVCDAEKKKKKI